MLDRLYGYEVSPVLWRKVNRGLSAGRVQSPSMRLIVERERERIAFVTADYWDIDAHRPPRPVHGDARRARRHQGGHRQGLRRATASRSAGVTVVDEARARSLADALGRRRLHRPLGRGEAVPQQRRRRRS
jgi:DNA topoisomerase-1